MYRKMTKLACVNGRKSKEWTALVIHILDPVVEMTHLSVSQILVEGLPWDKSGPRCKSLNI